MEIIKLTDFSFTYALGNTPALKNINLTVKPGEILTLCGASGSGKSTLLRCLKKVSAPAGKFSGGLSVPADRDTAIVFQNPDAQLVMTTVIDDLAFQMENRGTDPILMKKRVSETVAFFGIEPWLHKKVDTLSGGQKQLAALCAALMCEPELLLLDEPVSQLDPLAGAAFMEAVVRLNRELGVTIIIAEHRLDECAAVSDRTAFLEEGELRFAGEAGDMLRFLNGNGFGDFVPPLAKVSMMIGGGPALTPRQFREEYSSEAERELNISALSKADAPENFPGAKSNLVRLNDITFNYSENRILHRLDFSAARSEIICVVGGNGSGKSTLLKLMAKIIKPALGKAAVSGIIGYMPQNAKDYFIHERVKDEVMGWDSPGVQTLAEKLGVVSLGEINPFDLSGGQQQKCVLLAILSRKPDILLLDEPTKGMDPSAKKVLRGLLRAFAAGGGTAVIATHDMEFAAETATRCGMLFDGEMICENTPRNFFMDNKYYTTAIHKGLRHISPLIVTEADVQAAYRFPLSSEGKNY